MLDPTLEPNNISKACQLMVYSRQQACEIRQNFRACGAEGLPERLLGAKGPDPNRLSQEVGDAILDYCLHQPTHGYLTRTS